MLKIFPGGREPEVEGDGSRVVAAVRKGQSKKRSDLFKKVAQKMEEAGVVPI